MNAPVYGKRTDKRVVIAQIEELRAQRYTLEEVAEMVGLSSGWVKRLCARHRIQKGAPKVVAVDHQSDVKISCEVAPSANIAATPDSAPGNSPTGPS